MNWTTNSYNYMLYGNAEVAELADAHGSGPCGSNTVRVQVPSSALNGAKPNPVYFFKKVFAVVVNFTRK